MLAVSASPWIKERNKKPQAKGATQGFDGKEGVLLAVAHPVANSSFTSPASSIHCILPSLFESPRPNALLPPRPVLLAIPGCCAEGARSRARRALACFRAARRGPCDRVALHGLAVLCRRQGPDRGGAAAGDLQREEGALTRLRIARDAPRACCSSHSGGMAGALWSQARGHAPLTWRRHVRSGALHDAQECQDAAAGAHPPSPCAPSSPLGAPLAAPPPPRFSSPGQAAPLHAHEAPRVAAPDASRAAAGAPAPLSPRGGRRVTRVAGRAAVGGLHRHCE